MDIISNVDFFYKYRDTRFHNLSPLIKFLICATIIVLALILDNYYLLVLLLITVLIVFEARISNGWVFYMKVAVWISVFLILLNLILSPSGKTVLFEARLNLPVFDTIRITLESFVFGVVMALRLAVAISAFAVLSLTVSPEEMMLVMSKFRISKKSVFAVSLATRFAPSLIEDAETLSQVQRARGANLKGIRGKGPVIIPLLSNSLERSVSVAEAMEARGFGNDRDQ